MQLSSVPHRYRLQTGLPRANDVLRKWSNRNFLFGRPPDDPTSARVVEAGDGERGEMGAESRRGGGGVDRWKDSGQLGLAVRSKHKGVTDVAPERRHTNTKTKT